MSGPPRIWAALVASLLLPGTSVLANPDCDGYRRAHDKAMQLARSMRGIRSEQEAQLRAANVYRNAYNACIRNSSGSAGGLPGGAQVGPPPAVPQQFIDNSRQYNDMVDRTNRQSAGMDLSMPRARRSAAAPPAEATPGDAGPGPFQAWLARKAPYDREEAELRARCRAAESFDKCMSDGRAYRWFDGDYAAWYQRQKKEWEALNERALRQAEAKLERLARTPGAPAARHVPGSRAHGDGPWLNSCGEWTYNRFDVETGVGCIDRTNRRSNNLAGTAPHLAVGSAKDGSPDGPWLDSCGEWVESREAALSSVGCYESADARARGEEKTPDEVTRSRVNDLSRNPDGPWLDSCGLWTYNRFDVETGVGCIDRGNRRSKNRAGTAPHLAVGSAKDGSPNGPWLDSCGEWVESREAALSSVGCYDLTEGGR